MAIIGAANRGRAARVPTSPVISRRRLLMDHLDILRVRSLPGFITAIFFENTLHRAIPNQHRVA